MAYTIVIYSKYCMALSLVLFLLCGLFSLRHVSVAKQKRLAFLQSLFLLLVQWSAWLTIVIRTQRTEYLLLFAFFQTLTFAMLILPVMLYPGVSRILLNDICMLFTAGMIVLTRLDQSRAARQLAFMALSFFLSLFVPWIVRHIRVLRRLGWICCAAGIVLVGTVLLLGQLTNGSRLSWTVAGITFQPSEFAKVLYVFFLASVLGEKPGLPKILFAGIGAAAHVLILVLSRDLGSALIFFAVYILMISAASHRLFYALAGVLGGMFASAGAYRVFSHVQTRVQAWRDPWSVIDGQGYQITQSLFAISRGGLFGLGIGKGTPYDIPYVETDFIFAAMVEELGLVFGIGIVLTGVMVFLLLMRIACGLKDGFYKNLTMGYGFMLIFQIFLTIGGDTKFIPLTGVTLPLVSYGGSSVMATMLMLFVIQGICEMRYAEEREIEKRRKKSEKRAAADKKAAAPAQ